MRLSVAAEIANTASGSAAAPAVHATNSFPPALPGRKREREDAALAVGGRGGGATASYGDRRDGRGGGAAVSGGRPGGTATVGGASRGGGHAGAGGGRAFRFAWDAAEDTAAGDDLGADLRSRPAAAAAACVDDASSTGRQAAGSNAQARKLSACAARGVRAEDGDEDEDDYADTVAAPAEPRERRPLAGSAAVDESHYCMKPLAAMTDRDWRIMREVRCFRES